MIGAIACLRLIAWILMPKDETASRVSGFVPNKAQGKRKKPLFLNRLGKGEGMAGRPNEALLYLLIGDERIRKYGAADQSSIQSTGFGRSVLPRLLMNRILRLFPQTQQAGW